MNKQWSVSETKFVKDNVEKLKDREMQEQLLLMFKRKVSLDALRKFRQRLGINKINGRGKCGVKTKGI